MGTEDYVMEIRLRWDGDSKRYHRYKVIGEHGDDALGSIHLTKRIPRAPKVIKLVCTIPPIVKRRPRAVHNGA